MSASPQPLTLREAQVHAAEMGRRTPPPERYRWNALWWHLESRQSANPSQGLQYTRNLLDLRRDMLRRPRHYSRRPIEKTDYQWSQIGLDTL